MTKQKGYLVFDIGTGNARVAVVSVSGSVQTVEREDIVYTTEPLPGQPLFFSTGAVESNHESG